MNIEASIRGVPLSFETAPSLFSPTRVDAGTSLLLACVPFVPGDKVLDLGCGYGAIGIFAAKSLGPSHVYMIDSDPEAVTYAQRNARNNEVAGVHIELSDGFRDFRETAFTKILCNPPYHCDFSVAKHLIEKSFNRLLVGGTLWMVTKRDTWYRNKLTSLFGGVRVTARNTYFVFEARKKSRTYASRVPTSR